MESFQHVRRPGTSLCHASRRRGDQHPLVSPVLWRVTAGPGSASKQLPFAQFNIALVQEEPRQIQICAVCRLPGACRRFAWREMRLAYMQRSRDEPLYVRCLPPCIASRRSKMLIGTLGNLRTRVQGPCLRVGCFDNTSTRCMVPSVACCSVVRIEDVLRQMSTCLRRFILSRWGV